MLNDSFSCVVLVCGSCTSWRVHDMPYIRGAEAPPQVSPLGGERLLHRDGLVKKPKQGCQTQTHGGSLGHNIDLY